jgi:hypothetical protein
MTDECRVMFGRAFTKAMIRRYPSAAREARLVHWCEQHPADCDPEKPDRLRLLEADFLLLHDEVVNDRYKRQMVDAERQAASDSSHRSEQEQDSETERVQQQIRARMVQSAVDAMNQAANARRK